MFYILNLLQSDMIFGIIKIFNAVSNEKSYPTSVLSFIDASTIQFFFSVAGGEASFGSCFMYLFPCFMNPKVTAFYKLRYEAANSNFSPLQKDSNEPQCGFLNETAL